MFKISIDTDITNLRNYLREKSWLEDGENLLSIKKPGEGNMNVVLRVTTDRRSFILKQSRPFVEKYQQIKAPINRIAVEHRFYKAVQNSGLSDHIPKILGYDASDYLMMFEDLGNCDDMVFLYETKTITSLELEKLIAILGAIHKTKVPHGFPENMEMRKLNHQHIFVLPFMEENGFSLDEVQPDLQELSVQYKKDTGLKRTIEKVGTKYLSKGDTLIHGDYYPGSWMTETNNLYVIDPEFGFVGFVEFDLGVMAAHLIIATGRERFLEDIHDQYEAPANINLMAQVAGIEIMRRLIGLAQLPLVRTLEEKERLLKTAHKMILI